PSRHLTHTAITTAPFRRGPTPTPVFPSLLSADPTRPRGRNKASDRRSASEPHHRLFSSQFSPRVSLLPPLHARQTEAPTTRRRRPLL
uniref:Uncharacterized protein n=1 Tax=Aegilops tauschii subsp. strangulata TaxID=200361 RepID=A0A453EI77_AEGTS